MTIIAIVSVLILVLVVGFFVLKKKQQPGQELESKSSSEAPSSFEPKAPVAEAVHTSQAQEPEVEEATASQEAVIGEVEVRPELQLDEAPTEDESAHEELSVDSDLNEQAPTSAGTPPPPPQRESAMAQQEREAQLASLRKGLARSRDEDGFFGRLKTLFSGNNAISADIAEEIEEILLTSDVGIETTESLLTSIREALKSGELKNESKVWETLRAKAQELLDVPHSPATSEGLKVILLVGVNGAGKTTTIGKLAQKYQAEGKSVMMAAGDTFRAAAVDQLQAWGSRIGCEVITGKAEADPSSVLFDAIDAAKARGADILLADTAGRLHTKTNLMQEMTKIYKTAGKALEGAPHEVFLVIDSTNGQNALAQAREFKEAVPLSGLVLTKLDGTARGGVVLGICDALSIPVRFIGVGEGPNDLHEFNASAFVEALLGTDDEEIAASTAILLLLIPQFFAWYSQRANFRKRESLNTFHGLHFTSNHTTDIV